MIGGNDLLIDTKLSPEEQRAAMVLYLAKLWPDGVLEEDAYPDFFYYRTPADRDAWNSTEPDPSASPMVYVLPRDGQVTVTHNSLDEADVRRIFAEAVQPA